MFEQLPCTFEMAQIFGRAHPEFSMSIRFQAEHRLPLVQMKLYSYFVDGTNYYYSYKRQKVIKNEVYTTCIGQFNRKDYMDGFKIFAKSVALLDTRKKFLVVGDEQYTDSILPFLKEYRFAFEEYPTVLYFISKKQERILLEKEPRTVPDGYELDISTPEDAKIITDSWIHAAPGEEEQTRMKVSVFPSPCVRYKGEPVAFELVHANGMLNHLFVMKEHRGKLLGHIVQEEMARRLISENMIVYKTVETFNESVIRHTDKSPYWTKNVKADGSPLLRVYVAVWPEENKEKY